LRHRPTDHPGVPGSYRRFVCPPLPASVHEPSSIGWKVRVSTKRQYTASAQQVLDTTGHDLNSPSPGPMNTILSDDEA
jgi:hypothetical protein